MAQHTGVETIKINFTFGGRRITEVLTEGLPELMPTWFRQIPARWITLALALFATVTYWLFYGGYAAGADDLNAKNADPSHTFHFSGYLGLAVTITAAAAVVIVWQIQQRPEPDIPPEDDPMFSATIARAYSSAGYDDASATSNAVGVVDARLIPTRQEADTVVLMPVQEAARAVAVAVAERAPEPEADTDPMGRYLGGYVAGRSGKNVDLGDDEQLKGFSAGAVDRGRDEDEQG